MKEIKLSDLTPGNKYTLKSNQFNCENQVTFIGGDYSGLNRDIGYFCFHERTKKVPNIEQFAAEMKANKYNVNTFAVWGFELGINYEIK